MEGDIDLPHCHVSYAASWPPSPDNSSDEADAAGGSEPPLKKSSESPTINRKTKRKLDFEGGVCRGRRVLPKWAQSGGAAAAENDGVSVKVRSNAEEGCENFDILDALKWLKECCGEFDILDALKLLKQILKDDDGDDGLKRLSFVEICEKKGMTFPRPSWW